MEIQIATVVEGAADFRVIRNILRGLGIDVENSLFPLRPQLQQDATDLRGQPQPDEFGSWTNVRNECLTKTYIEHFFSSPVDADKKLLILQVDADVSTDYNVAQPAQLNIATDFSAFREDIINEINNWLSATYTYFDNTIYAIAIDSTDAWILALQADKHNKADTGSINKPKDKVAASAEYRKAYVPKKIAATYDNLSQDFAKNKKLMRSLTNNQSLKEFITSLQKQLDFNQPQ